MVTFNLCCLSVYDVIQVYQELVRLDEQELNNKYKIGVLYCKRGQTTEEDMYNNGKPFACGTMPIECLTIVMQVDGK